MTTYKATIWRTRVDDGSRLIHAQMNGFKTVVAANLWANPIWADATRTLDDDFDIHVEEDRHAPINDRNAILDEAIAAVRAHWMSPPSRIVAAIEALKTKEG